MRLSNLKSQCPLQNLMGPPNFQALSAVGHEITIFWDRDGQTAGKSKGTIERIMVDTFRLLFWVKL